MTARREAPLVILTPTLGHSPWLDETVRSVADHAPAARHVLIAPPTVVRQLRTRYSPLEVWPESTPRAGLYAALNDGLQRIAYRGWRWLSFLNDDDVLLSGFREVFAAASAAIPCHAPMVWRGEVLMIDGGGRRLGLIPSARGAEDILALVAAGYSPFNQQGMLLSREAVRRAGGFPTYLRVCADAAHWLRALERGAIFHQVPVPAAAFRVRAGQISADVRRHREEFDRLRQHAGRLLCGRALWPAVLRFRVGNLPRYVERVRRVGFRRGLQLLESPP